MSAPLARRLLALRLNGLVSLEGSCSQSPANLPCAAHRAGIACIRCGTQPSFTRTVLLSLFPVAGSGSAAHWPKAAPEHKRHVWVNDARAQLEGFRVAIIALSGLRCRDHQSIGLLALHTWSIAEWSDLFCFAGTLSAARGSHTVAVRLIKASVLSKVRVDALLGPVYSAMPAMQAHGRRPTVFAEGRR